MNYDATAIARHFDTLGAAEWDRFDRTVGDRVSLARHTELIERYAMPGHRILDIGAGPGRFTEVLHRRGATIVVADLSNRQLDLNREAAQDRGFASSVAGWHQLDICDLGVFPPDSFDGVVAYGGPLSYVFEHRDRAVAECLRVLKPGGYLLASVMSLWGTLHRHREALRDTPHAAAAALVATGDLTPATDPNTTHHCHLYRAAEFRDLLTSAGLQIEHLGASSAIFTGVSLDFLTPTTPWDALLGFEAEACVEPGYLDAGTHLLAAARRTSHHAVG